MSGPSPSDFLTDPLTEVTRRERRNLLIASTVGVLVASMGLIPTRLSALGIEFSAPAQVYFVALVAALVCYFFIAFIVYGSSDVFVCYKKYQDYLVASEIASDNWSQEDQERYDELHTRIPRAAWLYSWSKPVFFFRIVFEFVVPLLVGAVSVYLLLLKIIAA